MSTFEPGIYHDMTFETYLGLEAWGSSSLRAMRKGPPARVIWEKGAPNVDTSARLLGSAVHCALLTPHLFADTYVGKPEGMRFSTKEGKAWRDAHSTRKILSFEDFARVGSIVEALHAKESVAKSLDGAACEHSIIWRCPGSGELCKGRPDWISESDHAIYDLKVTRHGGTRFMAIRAYSEGWMHQLAHYRTGAMLSGADVKRGRLVVVEPDPPHFVWTLEVKRDALDLLELENGETLKLMRDCRVAHAWPGTPENEWTKIEPPAGTLDGLESVQFMETAAEQQGDEQGAF